MQQPSHGADTHPVNPRAWTYWLDVDSNVPCVEQVSEEQIVGNVRVVFRDRGGEGQSWEQGRGG